MEKEINYAVIFHRLRTILNNMFLFKWIRMIKNNSASFKTLYIKSIEYKTINNFVDYYNKFSVWLKHFSLRYYYYYCYFLLTFNISSFIKFIFLHEIKKIHNWKKSSIIIFNNYPSIIWETISILTRKNSIKYTIYNSTKSFNIPKLRQELQIGFEI